jgi:hypothetical protein
MRTFLMIIFIMSVMALVGCFCWAIMIYIQHFSEALSPKAKWIYYWKPWTIIFILFIWIRFLTGKIWTDEWSNDKQISHASTMNRPPYYQTRNRHDRPE